MTETAEWIGNQIKLAFTEEEDKLQENWSPHGGAEHLIAVSKADGGGRFGSPGQEGVSDSCV